MAADQKLLRYRSLIRTLQKMGADPRAKFAGIGPALLELRGALGEMAEVVAVQCTVVGFLTDGLTARDDRQLLRAELLGLRNDLEALRRALEEIAHDASR